MWAAQSRWFAPGRGFWLSLIVYNVPNGISRVQQQLRNGSWPSLERNGRLGQQFSLRQPAGGGDGAAGSRSFAVRVSDVAGTLYGTYQVPWPCGTVCNGYTAVNATAV